MLLDHAGREYAHWTFEGLPSDPGIPEVYLLGSWHELEWTGTAAPTRTARLLLAGPDNGNEHGFALVLPRGRYKPKVRLIDLPETIIRSTGELNVI